MAASSISASARLFGPDEYVLDIPGLTAQHRCTTPWYDILTTATRYGRRKQIELRLFKIFDLVQAPWALYRRFGDATLLRQAWERGGPPDMDAVRTKSIQSILAAASSCSQSSHLFRAGQAAFFRLKQSEAGK